MSDFQGWTVDDVLAMPPCEDYPRERLVDLWAGRERLIPRDVACLPIPAVDRIWLLCRGPLDVVLAAVEVIVTRAVERHAARCGIAEVKRWAAAWLSGEDRKWATADAAADAAARAAWAWAEARAAGAAAGAAEREQQIADFVAAYEVARG